MVSTSVAYIGFWGLPDWLVMVAPTFSTLKRSRWADTGRRS